MKYQFYSDELIDETLDENSTDNVFASSEYIDSMLNAVEKSITRSLSKQESMS